MKMKNLAGAFLALAAMFGIATVRAADIYDVHACDRYGVSINPDNLPFYTPDESMGSGVTVYFKVRFLPRQEKGQFSTNLWQFVYTGLSSQNVEQPKIGIFVSGVQTEATYIGMPDTPEVAGTLPTGEAYYYSDLIFAYTTKPGDFALPIVLAAKGADGRPTPASDVSENISEYFRINQGQNGWKLQFPMYDGGRVQEASWSIAAGVPNLSRLGLDPSLSKAGYCVRTVDFASAWEKPGEAWRVVHQGSTKTEKYEPQLEAKPAAAKAEILYVWSDDESSVVVDGREVTSETEWQSLKEKLSLREPVWMTRNVYLPETGKTKTRRVAMVKIDGGATTGDLTLRGVAQNTSTKLYLSAYDHFNVSDATSDDIVDYVTVPVACSEPLPPSVTVTTSTADAVAGYDYGHAAARITVSLPSADYAASIPSFKVKVTPKLSDGTDISDSKAWGSYVRFSADQQDVGKVLPDPVIPEVTLGGGVESASIFVFCLKGDMHTTGVNVLQFAPSSDDPSRPDILPENYKAGGFNVTAQIPEITEPEEGAKVEGNVYQYDDYSLTIKVEGSYADSLTNGVSSSSPTGYVVRVRYGNGEFEQLPGTYYPGTGNSLTKTGTATERPVLNFPESGENQTADIEVIAPASGRKSSEPDTVYRRIVADVKKQKTIGVEVTLPRKTEALDTIAEGSQVAFTVHLSDAYPGASAVYAFIQVTNEYVRAGQFDFKAVPPFIVGCTNKAGETVGLEIPRGTTVSVAKQNTVTLLDGYDDLDGGLTLDFNVLLSTEKEWSKAQLKPIKGYSMDGSEYSLTLMVTNVMPSVKSVKTDKTEVKTDPANPTRVAASDTRYQEFDVVLEEPSDYDLKNDEPSFYGDEENPGFRLKWEAYLDGEYQAGETLTDFHSKTVAFSNLFQTVGSWEIRIWAKDKDMADFTDDDEPTYSFPLEVVDSPTIIVNGGEERRVNETDARSMVEVELSLWPKEVTGTLVVELSKEVGRVGAKGDWGELELETNRVEFTKSNWNRRQSIRILRMDGTDNTGLFGWDVKGEAVTVVSTGGAESAAPKLPCVAGRVYIDNEAPNGNDESRSFSPDANTNVWEVAGGAAAAHPLKFFIRTDVDRDFTATATNDDWKVSEGVWTNGIKVTIMGGGGESYDTDGFVKGVKYFSEAGSGTFIPNFGSSQGDQEVTIMIDDKDGGHLSRTWKFTVTPSKYLTTVATGPSGGTSSSALSQKYSGASGLGEGHVFAMDKTFTKANDFRLHWNCSKDAKASLYAWGYKVGAVDDGTLDTHDQPLDATGAAAAGVTPGTYYHYGDPELDSFLYCWIQTVTDEKGAETSSYLGALAPERAAKTGASMAEVTLPDMNKDAKDNVYPETVVEAIFAREWLATDNMGDINQDGIPDLYVNQYKFDVIDETTGAIAEGGKDLKSLRDSNADLDKDGAASPDYLPTGSEIIFGTTFVPGLVEKWQDVGKEFTALLEIRGYGNGLNDAPALAGITGVKPDRIYAEGIETEPGVTNWIWSTGCTLSEVEFAAWCEYAAAHGLAVGNPADWEKWSPERPTNPLLDDTDGDEFTDGYEYYFWYKAHVGYMDANGVHRYLTGRAYDPRNPGEGRFIDSATIARTMDPRHDLDPVDFPKGYVEDPASAKTRDTDNDGLPDLLEFEIGTNPFDFDTDGDGLPDGFEIIVAGTDPLTDHTAKDAKHDAVRNYDGDAMAFTTVKRESDVLPLPRFIQRYYTFATVEEDGDTDGIQWYVETPLDGGVSAFTYTNGTAEAGVKFTVDDVDYVTTAYTNATDLPVVDGCLAVTLEPRTTFTVGTTNDAVEVLGIDLGEADCLRLRPSRVLAGTPLKKTAGKWAVNTTCAAAQIMDLAKADKCNAAWVYGSEKVSVSGHAFGFLALGRYQLPKGVDKKGNPGAVVAELPTKDRDVAFLHYLVYQQWGFDPRTAWSPNTPLAARWGKSLEGQALAEQVGKLGYAGTSTRTRAFTAYDEFLLYSFFLNNGCDMSGYTEAAAEAPYLAKVWMAFCTNPRGTGEPSWASDEHYQGWTAERDENGCDTDGDGVPDGWELYVMAGPKLNGKFNFAPPYAAFTAAGEEVLEMPESYFSPFVAAAKDNDTDNAKYIGKKMNDSLTEYQEFVSTDACAYYDEVQAGETAAYAKTPLLPADWTWLNKFFPTDPWVPDTDDDGVADNKEGSAFSYATAEDVAKYKDDKKKTVYPGCGLNPCSVDTDMDGIPDGWENQFAGSTVSTNDVAEGYIDGMDGTVADAQTSPGGPNRDYDRDGLENWQEYLTGTMRCWRYDDPFTQWGSIPFEAYYYRDEDHGLMFLPDFEALGIEGEDDEQRWHNFWYETLVNVGGPIYNPHLVFDQSPTAQYFSRVDKGWDPNYFDAVLASDAEEDDEVSAEHHYYWFAHRIGAKKYKDAWGAVYGVEPFGAIDPTFYVSCSPICEDSDQDGLDDYYELFHGLNPLLGGGSTPATINPCDLVWANKAKDKVGPASWNANPWTVWPFAKPRGTDPDYDFTVYPWKNGLQTADPDGDNERNYVEAIMAKFDSATGFHGDPSPMWMTDASYSNSLTRLHYRMPVRVYGAFMSTKVTDQNGDDVPGFKRDVVRTDDEGNVTTNTVKYFFRDFDAYSMNPDAPGSLEGFGVDRWKVGGARVDARVTQVRYDRGQEPVGGWMFSFEENEGYDTDHDGLNDAAEIAGRAHGATDPIDFDDPRRRQAMYFPGADSALQTPPQLIEQHPVVGAWYDEEFPFREYTVECWVRPDEIRNATVVERAILTAGANAGDRELVRRNFQLAIRTSGDKGYWFTKFDSNGTGEQTSDEVSVLSADEVVPGAWTHLAATFDGAHLTLFVNGKPSGTAADTTDSRQQPECGVSEINIRTGGTVAGDVYRTDGYVDALGYGYHAIIVGASVRSYSDYDLPFTEQWCGYAINLYNTLGWRFYRDFFKGYVDEIRIWDGARSVTQIAGSMGVRFTAEMAKENRAKVYDQWKAGQSRYRKDGNGRDYEGVEPELRYHFTFDSLLAADSAEALAKVPTGFANGPSAPYCRPDGYEISWWKRILETYGSAYAGAANYVTWIPNTVAHLPRFDGTTLDSAFWSADFAGDKSGTYTFANAAEPYSLWTQWLRGNRMGEAQSTLLRYSLANSEDYATTGFMSLFLFTGRNQLREGGDLLPLGGAYARYCEAMWDGQGPSTTHEITGNDSDSDGLPDWWEKYADEQYRGDLDPSVRISWDTEINYHGLTIAAGEAYLRDLAKGAYGDGNGKIAELPSKYRQIADEDANGVPDWWANLYGIRGESGLADHDNDGLPNYVEYLLSEVFEFKVMFNPVKACSVQREVPDYFYRPAGCQLYVGEIFTDHDLVDDAWEDLYPVSYASRLAWDAFADADQDGWSNRSENRYAKLCMPIVSDKQAHYTAADGLVADYPIPTLKLKLSYNGNRQDAVRTAPVAVQITTDTTLAKDPDATYRIVASADSTAGTGTDSKTGSSTSTETAMTRTLGKWSNRHAIGTLTPGNIKQNSLALEFCYDPSSIVYSWDVMIVHIDGWVETQTKRGTRAEYDADKRKYGDQNVKLLSTAPDYAELKDLELRTDEKSSSATWIHTRSGSELGTINLVTGEYDLNLGIFKDQFVVNGTNENDYVSLEDQTFRIAYTTNPSVGLPRELYLGEADTGHVKEGKNTIIAWAETVAADGVWQVGEPYGMVRDVDVSWRGTKAEIELTDLSPVTPRILLAGGSASAGGASSGGASGKSSGTGAGDVSSDRGKTVDEILQEIRSRAISPADCKWIDNNRITPASIAGDSFKGQRIRVVRWLVNDVPVHRAGTDARVVLDKKIETDVRDILTEADFLVGSEALDLDWADLNREVIGNPGTISALGGEEVRRVCYLIVVGDGATEWAVDSSTNEVVALQSVIIRKFGERRVKPVAVAPGAVGEEIVYSANPMFKWTMDCPEDEGYTAFRIQVTNNLGTVVYDSDLQPVPPRNAEGQYVWEAPLYVGDKTLKGEVFANKKVYGWKVAMYNAKYSQESNAGYNSGSASFRMQVQTNGYEYGSANVAVRYFGPQSSYQKKNPVIRVRAYTSPDFTGLPVAAGYVANPDDPANGLTAGTNAAPNCTVVGIPRGTYYLQAFIDSNANGVCDKWETQGYLCTRDGTTPDYLDPTAITFDSKVGKGDLAVIYLEDADTDGDGLPDAWEYAVYGSIEAKGVDLLTETKAGEFVVNTAISGALKLQENANVPTAGLAGEIRNTMTKLRSPVGVSAATGIDPADIEVTAGGLEVKSEVDPETLTIVGFAVDAAQNRVLLKVGAETTADINPTVANFLNITVKKGAEVTVKVERAKSPNGPWEIVPGVDGKVTVDKAGADIVVELGGELPAQGYFRAKVEEK